MPVVMSAETSLVGKHHDVGDESSATTHAGVDLYDCAVEETGLHRPAGALQRAATFAGPTPGAIRPPRPAPAGVRNRANFFERGVVGYLKSAAFGRKDG